MQAILLTNNLMQSEFIQKGLRYENLSCDIFMMQDDYAHILNRLPFYDGIFLLLNGFSEKEIMRIIFKIKGNKNFPLFILLQEDCPYRDSIVPNRFISGVFVRPFPFRNMSSDMKFAIFEEKERIRSKRYVLRDLELDVEKHQVTVNGTAIQLRNKEFALLHFLLMNSGKVMSRTTILENVWDRNANILTNTVDVHISQLRKKIEQHAEGKYFHTVPCTGYILE